MAVQPKKLLTYADYAAFPDDGLRHELIDGEDYVTPSASTRHQDLVGWIFNALWNHIKANGGGRVFVAPYDVVLSDHNVVEPDVVFLADSRIDAITKKNVQGSPTLAVEVVSDPRHDRVRKRELYSRFHIPTYWIVDPDADRVEVYQPTEAGYGKPEILERGDTLALPELPGFAIDLADMFGSLT